MNLIVSQQRLRELIDKESEETSIMAMSPDLHEQSMQSFFEMLAADPVAEPITSVGEQKFPHEAAGIPWPELKTVEPDDENNK